MQKAGYSCSVGTYSIPGAVWKSVIIKSDVTIQVEQQDFMIAVVGGRTALFVKRPVWDAVLELVESF